MRDLQAAIHSACSPIILRLRAGELLDHLAAERGTLDAPEDEAEITRYMRLLGGMAEESGELRAG